MITVASIIESVSTRKDRTYKIIIGTNEMQPSEAAQLLTFHQMPCYVAIKSESFIKDELEKIEKMKADVLEFGGKTDSQRLRNVLFLLWKQDGGGFADFNAYYAHQMNRLIEHFKSKIDNAYNSAA